MKVKSNCAVILDRGADGELQTAIPDANFGGDSWGDLCNADWTYSDDEEEEFKDEEFEKETNEVTVEKTVPEANNRFENFTVNEIIEKMRLTSLRRIGAADEEEQEDVNC